MQVSFGLFLNQTPMVYLQRKILNFWQNSDAKLLVHTHKDTHTERKGRPIQKTFGWQVDKPSFYHLQSSPNFLRLPLDANGDIRRAS